MVALFFSGCGSFFIVPYSFQPSYYEFKKLCELKNLPDGEEKYNKILNLYGTNLDTLDYSKFQETTTLNFVQQDRPFKKTKYAEDRYIYPSLALLYNDNIDKRITIITRIEFNHDKPQNKQHVTKVSFLELEWNTFSINSIEFSEGSGDFRMPTTQLSCKYFSKGK